MRPLWNISIGILILVLSGCEMKKHQVQTAPPPRPAAVRTELPPESVPDEPLSIPQTQVRLPNPQPINPQALATPPVPTEPSAPRTARKTPKRPSPPPAATASAKPEAQDTGEAPSATERPRQPIGPVLSDEARRKLNEDTASQLKEVDDMLARIMTLHLTDQEQRSAQTIRSFESLSRSATERGEIQQASELAKRALLLAQEVLRAHQ
jgi:hypothetical protein